MKTFYIILFSCCLLVPCLLKAERIELRIKGMVCAFCATGIEKKFKEEKATKTIDVDLDNKLVLVQTKADQTITDARLKELIEASGFKLVKVSRTGK